MLTVENGREVKAIKTNKEIVHVLFW